MGYFFQNRNAQIMMSPIYKRVKIKAMYHILNSIL